MTGGGVGGVGGVGGGGTGGRDGGGAGRTAAVSVGSRYIPDALSTTVTLLAGYSFSVLAIRSSVGKSLGSIVALPVANEIEPGTLTFSPSFCSETCTPESRVAMPSFSLMVCQL